MTITSNQLKTVKYMSAYNATVEATSKASGLTVLQIKELNKEGK